MPVTHSAKKKMRADTRKRATNLTQRVMAKKAVKTARLNSTPESLRLAQKALDKAVKTHVIHRNKAARLKSRLTKKRGN
ncbi:30S ribosomal protein S20 [Patescibacteria group bacterium]|nr:30S ribosomal protein S20 [Patescibacteria group bacterium]